MADVVRTTRWETTGTTKPDPDWRTVFMHDLPAHRGEEVTAEVLDGAHSVACAQAENRMYSAMAALEWCRGKDVA